MGTRKEEQNIELMMLEKDRESNKFCDALDKY